MTLEGRWHVAIGTENTRPVYHPGYRRDCTRCKQ